jgi:hypothetical protein
MANRLVGNSPDAAALEIALSGPTLRYRLGQHQILYFPGFIFFLIKYDCFSVSIFEL